jgi:FlaG/FlaF family flagellin (archaellin)
MKARTMVLSLVVLLAAATVCFAAADAQMGTWKLNEAKSKLAPGTQKNHTVVYAAAGDSVKVTVDGVDAAGKPAHNEWTGKFDGKDYAVTGDPASDMRAYKEVNDHTLSMTIKKGGKVTMTGTIRVSADGKTRTVTTAGTDDKGKKIGGTGVYDKQ